MAAQGIPEDVLSDEEKAKIESLGGLEKLIEEFRKRLAEQKGATRVATNGSVPAARHRSARTVITRRASGSDRRAASSVR
jgi:uncharacterized protein with von Willebrand factor type A (vWA) domain